MDLASDRPMGWWQSWRVFWSTSWPAWTVGMFLTMQAASLLPAEQMFSFSFAIGGLFQVLYFAGHVLLIPRMARKRFRGFRLIVEREDGTASKLTPREWALVAWRIALPQLLLLGVVSVAANMLALSGDARLLQSVSSLGRLIHLFGVGPLAVKYAVTEPYADFRFRVE
ncbi:MAG TPA: hypothetical protein VFQ91_27295 [Bryobacteraceae bacterium]|nr:hypothetical protein [Bryobacteraceae bacterium]